MFGKIGNCCFKKKADLTMYKCKMDGQSETHTANSLGKGKAELDRERNDAKKEDRLSCNEKKNGTLQFDKQTIIHTIFNKYDKMHVCYNVNVSQMVSFIGLVPEILA